MATMETMGTSVEIFSLLVSQEKVNADPKTRQTTKIVLNNTETFTFKRNCWIIGKNLLEKIKYKIRRKISNKEDKRSISNGFRDESMCFRFNSTMEPATPIKRRMPKAKFI